MRVYRRVSLMMRPGAEQKYRSDAYRRSQCLRDGTNILNNIDQLGKYHIVAFPRAKRLNYDGLVQKVSCLVGEEFPIVNLVPSS